ncbi:unnamed protein product [Paramecium octaurelia]|uniref:Uncharacterized protein n=1 Tax=Paramecium octaurelia TaxID=43137 RepID=A0A8S1TV45_PAROT|nr:unnamed protein product [Paramecium octaurelia]
MDQQISNTIRNAQKEKDIQILTGIIKVITQNIQYIKLNNLIQYQTFCLRRYEVKELNFGILTYDLFHSIYQNHSYQYKIQIEVFEKFCNIYHIYILTEDKYEETRIPRLRIIQNIIKSNALELAPYQEILLKPFESILKTLQQQLQKQDQNLDKEKEKFRLIICILQGLRLNSKEVDSFCGKNLIEQILKSVGQ